MMIVPLMGLIGAIAAAWLARGEKRLDWLVIAAFAILLCVSACKFDPLIGVIGVQY